MKLREKLFWLGWDRLAVGIKPAGRKICPDDARPMTWKEMLLYISDDESLEFGMREARKYLESTGSKLERH